MKRINRVIGILHAFIGVGAIFGGAVAIFDPTGETLGLSTDILKRGPFETFFIPGLFLLTVNGIVNLIAAKAALSNYKYQGYFSGIMGIILMMWIVIQCYILNDIMFLHVIYFLLGALLCSLALLLSIRTDLFPFNQLRRTKNR